MTRGVYLSPASAALWPHAPPLRPGLVSEQYPNSIADRFVRGLDKGRPGLAALRHAVRLHNPALRPEPTALIVHLRAGDVIDRSNYTVGQLLEKQRHYLIVKDGRTRDWGPYVRPRAFWRAVAAHFRGALRAVVLVAGGWGGMSAKSQRYVCAVHHVFAAAGYRVGVRYGELPDDDFAYMSRARYLVVGGGGFGLFVKTLVEAAHGTTYDPQPNGPAPGAAPPAARSGRSSLNAGPHVGEAHGADRGHGHRERIGREGPGHRNRRPRT